MKIGPKVGLLVAGLVTAQIVTVAGSGYLLLNEGRTFGALIERQSRELSTLSSLTRERGEQNRAFAELALHGQPRQGEDPAVSADRYQQFLTGYRERSASLTERTAAARQLQDPRLARTVEDYVLLQDQVTARQDSQLDAIRNGTYHPQDDEQTLFLGAEGQATLERGISAAHRRAAAEAADTRAASTRLTGIAGLLWLGLTLVSVLFAAVMTGRIIGPLRRLTRNARQVADTILPQTVDRIRRSTGDVRTPVLVRLSSGTRGDELEALAHALNDLQDSAVALAVETRRKVLASGQTLINLGQRNQSLLNRMLSYMGELEHHARDPQVLAHLLRLEHLTARIRRNAESMLVLAGAEQTRTQTRPVPLPAVARAALSEIEDHTRVRVGPLDGVAVHGPPAADLSHLLAELLENATRFSEPDSPVLLQGGPAGEGYRFLVHDHGLGMSEQALRAANHTLATAEESHVSARVIGLYVIGRLAARHGIRAHLRHGEGGGCVAVIDLPADILVKAGRQDGARPKVAAPAPDPVEVTAPVPVTPRVEVAGLTAPGSPMIPLQHPVGTAKRLPRRPGRRAPPPDPPESIQSLPSTDT